MPRRLYSWTQIGGWEIGQAVRLGELRALCHRPDCEHAVRFKSPNVAASVKLYEIARRMRCTGCARLGAHLEIWATDGLGGAQR